MNRAELPSGNVFVGKVIAGSSALAVPALAIVLSCAALLLEMTTAMWHGFWLALAGYMVIGAPLNYLGNRRFMASISSWLDAEDPDPAHTERAFAALMAFPQRIAVATVLYWLAPVTAVSVVMQLRFPETWGSWHWGVLFVGGLAAGFSAGVMMGLMVKRGVFAQVREAAAHAVGRPEARRRLVPRVLMRTKLVISLTGATLVPVAFAMMIAVHESESSVERFAIDWAAQVLEGVSEADDPSLAAVRNALQSPAMPTPMVLIPMQELGELLPTDVASELGRTLDAGNTSGDSLGLPSPLVFSWRRLEDGSAWAAAVTKTNLYAHGTVSLGVLFCLMVLSAMFAWVVAYFLARDISAPVAALRATAQRLADGDLRSGRIFESEDELGELARAFDEMAESLRTMIARVASAADGVEARSSSLGPVCESLSVATAEQVRGTRRAASSMEEINAQVSGIARSSQALNSSVEESSSSILELGASGEELNETASLLSSKVEQVSTSIEQMVRSVRQVSENTESLSSAAEETSASMEEMASSLREVDTSAAETARLSATVVERAEIGRVKVRETIAGMDAIREATDTAETVIRSLHDRTVEIGAIVDVIDDVADETNLLALNAAIIAAQAGDHGRAFSVVADEIKDLAERVLASTKEIGGLIRAVQDESQKANRAIERGSASVASGVDLSAEAGMALEEITEASRQSGDRIGGIVAALREQAKAAGHVVGLMERVRGGVDEIRQAAAEQDRGNEVVFQGAVTMREVALQVRGTTEEQARGSSRIRESVEGVREAVEQINAALQEQSDACASAAEFLESVQGRTGTHEEATPSGRGCGQGSADPGRGAARGSPALPDVGPVPKAPGGMNS